MANNHKQAEKHSQDLITKELAQPELILKRILQSLDPMISDLVYAHELTRYYPLIKCADALSAVAEGIEGELLS